MEREQQLHKYAPEVFHPDAGAPAAHRAVSAAASRAVGPAERDARLRPARRDLPRAERDFVPRDARLLSQVHGRRAHAADGAQRRAAAHQPAVRRRCCASCASPSCWCWRCCITTSERRGTATTRSSAPKWRRHDVERLDLDDEARQTIDFLIRNHLKMSRIAFRRDTEEPEVVRQFASLFSTRGASEDARAADARRRRRRQPGHADAVEGGAAVAAVRRCLQPDDARLRRRHHRSRPGAGRGAPGEPAGRHLGSRDGAFSRRAAAAISDPVFAGRDLSSRAAVARHPARRRALLPREEGRGVGADRRLARQAVSVLEHLRRARRTSAWTFCAATR